MMMIDHAVLHRMRRHPDHKTQAEKRRDHGWCVRVRQRCLEGGMMHWSGICSFMGLPVLAAVLDMGGMP